MALFICLSVHLFICLSPQQRSGADATAVERRLPPRVFQMYPPYEVSWWQAWQCWPSKSNLLPYHNTCPVYFLFLEVLATRFSQYMSSLLSVPRSAGYSVLSADHPLLSAPRTRTSTAGRCFSCARPLVWNSLPDCCKLWHILWL